MQENISTKNNKYDSASHKCFCEFVRFISNEVIENFGASYETQAEIRNTWRDKYKYSPVMEKFLIKKAKLFIATLDSKAASTYDLSFLHAVVREITDYLSRYTMRKQIGMLRKEARDELKLALWDNNTHINALRLQQEKNRFAKKSPKYAIQKRKDERREMARQEREIQQQIKAVFIESAYYRKK